MINCHNNSLEYQTTHDWNVAFGAAIAIISLLAVVENGIIILLFYKNPKLRTPSNKVLLSVVTADWLTGLTVGPFYSAQLLNQQLNHNCILHNLRHVFGVLIIGASLSSIVFLTIDRTRHLIKLSKYSMGNCALCVGICACWFLPLVAAIVGMQSQALHSVIVFIVGIAVIVIILACYGVIIYALQRHQRNMMNESESGVGSKRESRSKNLAVNERKAVKMVVLIITCYVIMLLPTFAEKGVHMVRDHSRIAPWENKFHLFTALLLIGNSCVNPIIYTSRLNSFKKSLLKLIGVSANTGERSGEVVSSSMRRGKTVTQRFSGLYHTRQSVHV